MVTLTVMYPYAADKPFDADYYGNKHIPLAQEVWGDAVKDVQVYNALAGMGADPAFSTIAMIEFTSMEAFQQAMAHPRGPEVQADVANFTAVTPQIQISQKA